MNANITDMGH